MTGSGTLRTVPRLATEQALHYLAQSFQEHVRSVGPSSVKGRVASNSTALGFFDAEAAARQGCLLRMVSVVEAYVDVLSSALFEETVVARSTVVRKLVTEAELRSATTWNERRYAFETFHGVRFSQVAGWDALLSAIEVRNTIAHGLGSLTAKQRIATKDLQGKFNKIGVGLSDGRILLSFASLEKCRETCAEFIRSLDIASRA